jgi:V/A-type H+/Na+-transporting ATPase subunit E
MTPDENIERLSRDIIQQAESEAAQILSEAKSKGEQIKQHAQEVAAAERVRILNQAKRDSERIRSQAIATTQLKARTMQLESRENLLKGVFSASLEKISTVQQWNDYETIVEKLAQEAIEQIGAEKIVIHSDKFTNKILAESILKKNKPEFGEKIQLGDLLQKGTGLVAETSNGHLTYDNTLETRMQKLENELRAPVYHLLMGESL